LYIDNSSRNFLELSDRRSDDLCLNSSSCELEEVRKDRQTDDERLR
jgi:hypothetical protein